MGTSPTLSKTPPLPADSQRKGRRRPPNLTEQARRRAWGVEQGNAVKQHWAQLKGRR